MSVKFSKRIIMSVVSLTLCIAVAVASLAVSSASGVTTSRTITVDTGSVIQDSYEGIGNNLWCGPYFYGMNDAYQLVNNKRTNTVKPAFMRMMFYPQWIVYLDEDSSVQEQRWNEGIYNFDSLEYKNFVIRCKMFEEAGTIVQLNFGGIVDPLMQDWFGIPGSSRYGTDGTRAAPRNLEAFAQAAYSLWYQLYYVEGLENVRYFSFYNEVNGSNYETVLDKRIYYSRMVKEVHEKFVAEGKRDLVRICGTDFSGWWTDDMKIPEFFEVAISEQTYEDGTKAYDYLATHSYVANLDTIDFKIGMDLTDGIGLYNAMLEGYKTLTANVPDLYITEFSGFPEVIVANNAAQKKNLEFGVNETSMIIAQSNAGMGGTAAWFYMGEYIPYPTSVGQSGININLWVCPSQRLSGTSELFGVSGTLMRYIPKKSTIVKTTNDSDDIISATYLKDGDISVVSEVEKSADTRNLTVNIGSAAAGKTFKRIIYYFPEDIEGENVPSYAEEEDTVADTGLDRPDGDLLPYADKIVTANSSGVITDTLPTDRHMTVIYTTMDEQVQVVTGEESAQVEMKLGETKTFTVDAIYGTKDSGGNPILDATAADLSAVTWEIGKNDYVAADDGYGTGGGYGWTTNNVGNLVANGSSATYTATSGQLNVGDTVAIKVSSNYSRDALGLSAYTVIIVKIVA
ncbi:MAG: hypothetical protein IJZ75_02950 [Clostridia bacterium]|nr:hypothetical protein [Clostridia bacterium]